MKRNIYSRFIAAAALLFHTAAAFPVSAEDIAPNLNSATVSFSEKTACYLYTGKQITPAFSVYLANDIQLPASKYSWTVISKDGDGTSAGTEPGTVKIEIAGTPESGLPGKCTVSYQIVRPGDCNCDGVLDASDADMMQKWLFNSEQISFWKAGDLNRDGRLNAVDLTMLKRSILNSHERTEVSMKITGKSAETLPDGFAEKFQSAVKTINSKLDFSDFTFEAHGMKLIEKSTPAPIEYIGKTYYFYLYYKDILLDPNTYTIEVNQYDDGKFTVNADFMKPETLNLLEKLNADNLTDLPKAVKTAAAYAKDLEIPEDLTYGYPLKPYQPDETFGNRPQLVIDSLKDASLAYIISSGNPQMTEFADETGVVYVMIGTEVHVYVDAKTGEVKHHFFRTFQTIA